MKFFAALSGQRSAGSFQRAASSGQPSAFSYQFSAISRQPIAANLSHSSLNPLPLTLNLKSSAVSDQLSAGRLQRAAISGQPTAANLSHSSLNPLPFTLYLQPSSYSLQPKISNLLALLITAAISLLALPDPAQAYIGPGAGFALVSSFFILIIAIVLALFSLLTLPVRTVYLHFKRRKVRKNAKVRRIIVLGFDGLDPDLCRQYMNQGGLKNLSQLADIGSFHKLATTTPAISPVAWSTFSTGVNPGKHRIFDFFTRDARNYLPVLSSALIASTKKKIGFGVFKFVQQKPLLKFLRMSISFWKILGEHKIFSSVLRVPITFPPEKFYGVSLAGMCAPDLRGTQGSFTLLTSRSEEELLRTKGEIIRLRVDGTGTFHSSIPGPAVTKDGHRHSLQLPVTGKVDRKLQTVELVFPDTKLQLRKDEYSPWVRLHFQSGRKKITGITRILLRNVRPEVDIYLTPIHIDPEKPNMPVSHPSYYSIALAKIHGPFATLGLSEDTWALNEGVINEQEFLTHTYDIYDERKRIFLDAFKNTRDGLLVNVFDTTDRIQHMFFRYLDEDHPANEGKDIDLHKNAIADVYEHADQLVGEVMEDIKPDDLLLVMSDHGFKHFKWGINLNTWLWQQGYLVLKNGCRPGKEWFVDVDWSKTRAYGFGLAGIFINTRGREKQGIVAPGKEKQNLLKELKAGLESIHDAPRKTQPIVRAIFAEEELKGPYVREAPDIFLGYREGYRVSWNSATGRITQDVIEPNTKRWSGDHCVDPERVPGVLFSNRAIQDEQMGLEDLGPTILHLFGIQRPKFVDGKVLRVKV